jgi:hypothetical protein
MVIVLLYQIVMMIVERYVARTENRQQIERKRRVKETTQPCLDQEKLFLPQKYGDATVRLVI